MGNNPLIKLSWPSAAMSGHNNGNWSDKTKAVKAYRNEAFYAVKEMDKITIPDEGDIRTVVTFTPPNNRSDRLNYVNRMKPFFDGVAMALKVNDKRFCIPVYVVNKADLDNHGVTIEIL